MNHTQARAAIETGFAESWSATPIAFENVAFDPPAHGSPWVRMMVTTDGGHLASIGGPPRRYRCLGRVVLEISAPAGTGSRTALALADQAIGVFAAWPASDLVFLAGTPGPGIQLDDGYRITVTVPFRHDDLR